MNSYYWDTSSTHALWTCDTLPAGIQLPNTTQPRLANFYDAAPSAESRTFVAGTATTAGRIFDLVEVLTHTISYPPEGSAVFAVTEIQQITSFSDAQLSWLEETPENTAVNVYAKVDDSRSNGTIIGYGHPLYSETDTEEKKPDPAPAPATEPTTGEIVLGSTVAIKPSAERYNPTSAIIPDWVKTDYNHIVTQVTVNGKPFNKGGKTCVLLGKKVPKKGGSIVAGIMTWVAVENLQLVSETKQATTTYTVQKGDTLWEIAKKHLGSGARYTEIVKLNGLKTSTIYSGQKLKLPEN